MADMLEPDLCVIGSGPGAIAAVTAAAALGARTVLVRHGPASTALKLQALLTAARRAYAIRNAGKFGIGAGDVTIDFAKLKEHVRHVMAGAAPNEAPERLAGLGIRVIEGAPSFTGANLIAVDDHFEIKPKHVVIATGSVAVVPAIEGLNGEALTPDTVFDLAECPKSLAVIGATAEGLALAQAFLRLGSEVTVIEPDMPLPEEDAECIAILLDRLQAEGIVVRKGRVTQAAKSRNAIALAVENAGATQKIEVSHVLVANGRRPALDDLNLGAAGVAVQASGITVDDYQRTSNPKVYAIGEAVGSHSIEAANQQAALVVRSILLDAKAVTNSDIVPRVIFTDPEFAHVGLNEERARARHGSIRILRWPFHENDRAQAERDTKGHVKIVTLKDGRIIGASILGRGAADQIASFALAVERRLGAADLAGWIAPYPSRAEAGKRALTAYSVPGLTRKGLGRIINSLWRGA